MLAFVAGILLVAVLSLFILRLGQDLEYLGERAAVDEESLAKWNSWVSRLAAENHNPVDALLAGADPGYVLKFDLSLYSYDELFDLGGLYSTSVDRALDAKLQALIDEGFEQYTIGVRAAAIGTAIEVIAPPVSEVSIDLTRLLEPEGSEVVALRPGETLDQFSERTSAARIEVGINAVEAGCAAVVISISKLGSPRPLDNLIRVVRVVDEQGVGPECWTESDGGSFAAGLETLLRHRYAPSVDAALHIVEVVLPDREAAVAFYLQADGVHREWELEGTLTSYLSDKSNLEALIQESRKPPFDYRDAANELRGAVYSGRMPQDEVQAEEAYAQLSELVRKSVQPPVILVRLVDENNSLQFIPLSLVGALFERPIEVVFPLPLEDYRDQPACIRHWTLAIPTDMDGPSSGIPRKDLQAADDWWLHGRGDSLNELRRYLSDSSTMEGEGLVLLAHHSGGRIYYRHDDRRLQYYDITRRFGPGSAAVLAICSAGGIREADMKLLRRLNRLGIQSFIMSPFEIHADYGQALAVEFASAVRRAKQSGGGQSIAEILEDAKRRTVSRLVDKGDFSGMGLEMIIAGNHTLTLCSTQ